MRAWLWHHVDCLAAALARHARAPYSALLNFIVMGVALALPAGLYVVLAGIQASASTLAPEPQLSLFLAVDAGPDKSREVAERLKQHSAVRAHRYVPRDQALAELKASAGLADVVDGLPHNPLPDAFVVEPREISPEALAALSAELSQWPGIAHVQVDSAWARRLATGLKFGRLGVAILAALFAFALVAITFNTIRLQVLTRREEVEVASLIGATAGFIRRPFLYFGVLQGLGGGIAAWAIVWLAVHALNGPLAELSALYGTPLQLEHLDSTATAVLIVASAVLGWLGSWLSVTRHLASEAARPTPR